MDADYAIALPRDDFLTVRCQTYTFCVIKTSCFFQTTLHPNIPTIKQSIICDADYLHPGV
jgi:hypothetical protein